KAKTKAGLRRDSRPGSKQARVLAMLGRPEGATIAAIMRATHWQQQPPSNPGESHVGFCKSLLTKGKWILKVASDSEGAADERIWRVLCRPARPARGECAARFDRDFVHRVAGDAVRSDELHRHGAVCADEGVSLASCSGAQEWLAKPRHIQPCLPHARSEGVRDIVPTFHESL